MLFCFVFVLLRSSGCLFFLAPPRALVRVLSGKKKKKKVLSTILSNPREGGGLSSFPHRKSLHKDAPSRQLDEDGRVVSRATLIVVPVSLVGQWAEVRGVFVGGGGGVVQK